MKITYHKIQEVPTHLTAKPVWADVWKAAGRAILGRPSGAPGHGSRTTIGGWKGHGWRLVALGGGR